jgi:hypothetical protein
VVYWVICISEKSGRAFIEKQYFLSESSADDYREGLQAKTLVFESEHRDRKEAVREIREKLARQGKEGWSKNFKHGIKN